MSEREDRRLSLGDAVRFHLSPEQKERIHLAALKTGKRPAEFIRDAVLTEADRVLAGDDAMAAFSAFIGLVDVPGSFSRDTGSAFTELLKRKRSPD